ncbi:putative PIF1 DNA helicase/replication protein A1-like protein [Senna tora]|uniref:Putative PIF1 DNA helicase/replication protein A1-like protein n=1 Tax=Senna tora TaxID=362788 RepID=A0A834SY61_9FABA|nr:putative PIF1 DNA helicase/replication protein A1-like protein [Senna tora]
MCNISLTTLYFADKENCEPYFRHHAGQTYIHIQPENFQNKRPRTQKIRIVRTEALAKTQEYRDISLPTYECEYCGAIMWYEERVNKAKKLVHPKFSLCFMQGKVQLPDVKKPPKLLFDLFTKKDRRSVNFMKEIKNYNHMFVFTSMDGKIDHSVNNSKGPYPEETLYRHGSISGDRKQRHLILSQYFAYKLQDRHRDFNIILEGGKLTQQFIMDGFTMVEAQRTNFSNSIRRTYGLKTM